MAGVQGFEPWKWRNQNPLPYRLAIPQYQILNAVGELSPENRVIVNQPASISKRKLRKSRPDRLQRADFTSCRQTALTSLMKKEGCRQNEILHKKKVLGLSPQVLGYTRVKLYHLKGRFPSLYRYRKF